MNFIIIIIIVIIIITQFTPLFFGLPKNRRRHYIKHRKLLKYNKIP